MSVVRFIAHPLAQVYNFPGVQLPRGIGLIWDRFPNRTAVSRCNKDKHFACTTQRANRRQGNLSN